MWCPTTRPFKERKLKKFLLTMCAALAMSSGAQALETSVAPKVTPHGIDTPKTARYVGYSYSV